MNDELHIWYRRLKELKSNQAPASEKIDPSTKALLAERKQITDAWLATAFSDLPELTLDRYFRFHQQELKSLTTEVESLVGTTADRKEAEDFLNELKELQAFLNRHFARYLLPLEILDILLDKVLINLSVAQLGCILRLTYESGLFPNITVAELIRCVVLYCRTRKQLHISARSLSKEYYSVNQVTAATCRELLTQLIKRIDKMYFQV